MDSKLVGVNYGGGECWLYPSKSTGGASQSYGRMKFHGVWVMAHRFALAVKLGFTLWDLEGFDASHAPLAVCVGGRCCNPEHLTKKLPKRNRSWDRIRDGLSGPKKKRPELLPLMYPTGGLPKDDDRRRLYREAWRSSVKPRLITYLKSGFLQ